MLKTFLSAATLLLASTLACAQTQSDSHEAHHPPAASAAETAWVPGEVRRLDAGNRKITLRHGEIRNLNMPAMTMVYQVPDAQWLAPLQVGDRVRFTVDQVNGVYVLQRLEKLE